MKIGCIDRSAADRLALQQRLETAYEECRASLALLKPAECVLLSPEECRRATGPEHGAGDGAGLAVDALVIGSSLPLADMFALCRRVRDSLPQLPLFVFLPTQSYTVSSLRRLERFRASVFSDVEQPVRLVHELVSLAGRQSCGDKGKLLVLSGAKGGVGVTSVTTGLAHAAHALGRSSVILDLSLSGVLARFLRAERAHSPEFAAALTDRMPMSPEMVSRCLSRAPSGLELLLPPAGGGETRELWLRTSDGFEGTLAAIEILQEQFDLIVVDTGGADGLLPYGLHVRADHRVLVTSNEPASVFLLHHLLEELTLYPGTASTAVIVNMLHDNSLTHDDVVCSVRDRHFEGNTSPIFSRAVPADAAAALWMGTGNSFYTEGRRSLQAALELVLLDLIEPEAWRHSLRSERSRWGALVSLIGRAASRTRKVRRNTLLLPNLPPGKQSNAAPVEGAASMATRTEDDFLASYSPPKRVVNE